MIAAFSANRFFTLEASQRMSSDYGAALSLNKSNNEDLFCLGCYGAVLVVRFNDRKFTLERAISLDLSSICYDAVLTHRSYQRLIVVQFSNREYTLKEFVLDLL